MIRGNFLSLAASRTLDRYRLKPLVAEYLDHVAVQFDVNIVRFANLVNQILRHARFQRFSAHQHNHASRML
jgi:hypothetical protein